jgi:hypothetical protein
VNGAVHLFSVVLLHLARRLHDVTNLTKQE